MLLSKAAFFAALSVWHARAALSATQMQAIFPANNLTDLRGGGHEVALGYNLTVVGNSTHALVSLQVTDSPNANASDIGWLGIGRGPQMVGSDDFVLWPTKNGSWVLSHRVPTRNTQMSNQDPGDAGASTDDDFFLVDDLCSGRQLRQATAQVTFLKKLKPGYEDKAGYSVWSYSNKLDMTFARSSENPGSSSISAKIGYHDLMMGSLAVDFSSRVRSGKSFGVGPVLNNLVVATPTASPELSAAPTSQAAIAAVNSTLSSSSAGLERRMPSLLILTLALIASRFLFGSIASPR